MRSRYVAGISVVAALGGFLFGFDTAVISGAISPLSDQFDLHSRPALQGWTVSSALLGSVIGAVIAGFISDRFGRKKALSISAVLFLISAVFSAIAPDLTTFIMARLVGGFGVGIAAMVAPLYISEVSPPRIRGRLVAMYQLAICIGVLLAYITNECFRVLAESANVSTESEGFSSYFLGEIWRGMLGIETIPALLFFFLLFFVPRSPRYSIYRGAKSEALDVLRRINGPKVANEVMREIEEAIADETGSMGQLFHEGLRKATFIALFLAVVSQLSGIDIVLHYGPLILERAGFSFSGSLTGQIIFGLALVAFTLLAMWKVDDLGRRKLLFLGNCGIVVSLLLMGYQFQQGVPSESTLIFVISLFIASFAFSLGPIPWIIMAEIFPTKIRGRAMALATFTLFGANWLVAQLFPVLSDSIGEHGTFYLLAFIAIPTFFFIWKVLPETKGMSLEVIERSWAT